MRRLLTLLACLMPLSGIAQCPENGLRIGYIELGANYHDGRGIDAELMQTLAQRAHCPIVLQQDYPRLRTLRMMEQGELNVLPSLALSPERAKLGYPLHYQTSKNMTLLHKRFAMLPADKLTRQPGIRWGRVRGYVYSPQQTAFMDQMQQQQQLVEATDTPDLVRLLERGMVDGVLAHPLVFDGLLRDHPLRQRLHIYDAFPSDPPVTGVIMLSRQAFSESQAQEWQAWLQQMRQDGSLLTLYRKYLSPDIASQIMPK